MFQDLTLKFVLFSFVSRWMHCKCVKIVRLRKMWEGQRARERPRRWALAIGESVYWHNGFSVARQCYLSHTSLTFVLYISDWVLVFLVWSNQRFCYSPYRPTNEVREIVILCRRMVSMYSRASGSLNWPLPAAKYQRISVHLRAVGGSICWMLKMVFIGILYILVLLNDTNG